MIFQFEAQIELFADVVGLSLKIHVFPASMYDFVVPAARAQEKMEERLFLDIRCYEQSLELRFAIRFDDLCRIPWEIGRTDDLLDALFPKENEKVRDSVCDRPATIPLPLQVVNEVEDIAAIKIIQTSLTATGSKETQRFAVRGEGLLRLVVFRILQVGFDRGVKSRQSSLLSLGCVLRIRFLNCIDFVCLAAEHEFTPLFCEMGVGPHAFPSALPVCPEVAQIIATFWMMLGFSIYQGIERFDLPVVGEDGFKKWI
jgi:hypothetical protein